MTEPLVTVDRVSKKFCRRLRTSLWYGLKDFGSELRGRRHGEEGRLRPDEFWALRDVSLEVMPGECVGLIGPNGAGKTTLLKMLNGLVKPDGGSVKVRGRVGALIALGAGFNPVLSGRENIYVNAALLGFTRREINDRFSQIVDFAGVGEFIDSPVQHYSSGMHVRLGFAVAAHLNPDVMLVDEALAVGDMAFGIMCLNRIAELRRQGTAVIFVSHNELQVREAAQSCLLLNQGIAQRFETPDEAFLAYDAIRTPTDRSQDADIGFVHDGPIRLEVESIHRRDGQPARTGEVLDLELRCRAKHRCEGAELELRFWNSSGQLITTIKPISCGIRFEIPQGDSRIRVSTAALPLSPGKYRLAGGFRRAGEVLAWVRDLAHFEVERPQHEWMGTGLAMVDAQVEGPTPCH
jgi:lipopolysaccharide transport system ATP-binding protein